MSFQPRFTITNRMTSAITRIERVRGFLEAAQLSTEWVREVGEQALMLEAHHTTHIEGTQLTLEQAARLWKGETVPDADADDTRKLLNYRTAFEFVSECLRNSSSCTSTPFWMATDVLLACSPLSASTRPGMTSSGAHHQRILRPRPANLDKL